MGCAFARRHVSSGNCLDDYMNNNHSVLPEGKRRRKKVKKLRKSLEAEKERFAAAVAGYEGEKTDIIVEKTRMDSMSGNAMWVHIVEKAVAVMLAKDSDGS